MSECSPECAELGRRDFSVSVNFRVSGDSLWENMKRAVGGSWPNGFLVRQMLTRKTRTDFAAAKTLLRAIRN